VPVGECLGGLAYAMSGPHVAAAGRPIVLALPMTTRHGARPGLGCVIDSHVDVIISGLLNRQWWGGGGNHQVDRIAG
jgi:hypothetical protein